LARDRRRLHLGTAAEIAIFVVVGLGFNLLLGYTACCPLATAYFGLMAYGNLTRSIGSRVAWCCRSPAASSSPCCWA
jgi:ABC-type branched-subunit amino acid transport system permease subunit